MAVLSAACASAGDDLATQPVQELPQASAELATQPVQDLPQASADLPNQPVQELSQTEAVSPWWNDTVFYEIFVRSFYDSYGDGIGDLPGLIQKLDYLNDGDPKTTNDLGVTGLWLMPIHPAASYHGYDVIDYFSVNPEYGSLDDFKRFLEEAHQRGLRVIIDLVLNHTSTKHPWFIVSQTPSSPYRDWYIWSDTKPGGLGWHESSSGFYYGIFWEGMPDLNYRNPEVTDKMRGVTRFWLEEVGVDGFRLDGVKHLVEEGSIQAHAQGTHSWLREFRTFYKGLNPQAFGVGEIWDISLAVSKYVTNEEVDLAFSFDLAQAMVTSARLGRAYDVARVLRREVGLFPSGQFGTFLTNHDQERAMYWFTGESGKARVAAGLLLTSPGVPFIYYGEEIGMTGKKPDEQIRTPMQWSSAENAGFTNGEPWIAVNPDFAEGVNVASQTADDASLLSYYRELIGFRSRHAALRVGEFFLAESDHKTVLAFLRVSEDEILLVVINLGREPVQDYSLSMKEGPLLGTYLAEPIFGYSGSALELVASQQGAFESYQPVPELKAQHTLILQLQPGR